MTNPLTTGELLELNNKYSDFTIDLDYTVSPGDIVITETLKSSTQVLGVIGSSSSFKAIKVIHNIS